MKLKLYFNHPEKGVLEIEHTTDEAIGPNSPIAECDGLRKELGLDKTYALFTSDGVLYCSLQGDTPADIGEILESEEEGVS